MDRRVSGPKRDWLNAEQAASWMGVGDDVFRELVKDGKLPPAAQISKGKALWNWLDLVAYMHLAGRFAGQMPPAKAEKT